MHQRLNYSAYLSELIGTFILVFNGTGAIMVNEIFGGVITHLGIAFAFGLTVAMLIYTFRKISGANFNPAVSIALWSIKRLSTKDMMLYIASQVIGAILASILLKVMFGNIATLGATLPNDALFDNEITVALAVELIYTFILMVVILGAAVDNRADDRFGGIAIGITVMVGALIIGPISGGSFNPARSLGPALISGHVSSLWLYIVFPIIGALLAVFATKKIFYLEDH
ncbi:MIP/aquaporin family protein [Vallitalea okinawensis]|uniref:MIP/aquaporin family protein n=1 Tax=Vallitalea okinawensis TaxID=2078660 RepID=UPI000CFCF8D7|nr:aquaporin [Vallitalea okinawensis]